MTRIEIPVDTSFDRTHIGDKVGRAHATTIMGWFAFGDASIQAAARDGRLTRVDHVDAKVSNVLFGVWHEYETIVYGE